MTIEYLYFMYVLIIYNTLDIKVIKYNDIKAMQVCSSVKIINKNV